MAREGRPQEAPDFYHRKTDFETWHKVVAVGCNVKPGSINF
jgi:hypothetical protein